MAGTYFGKVKREFCTLKLQAYIIVQNYDVWAVTKTSCKFLLNLSINLSFHNFGENMYIEAN